MPCYGDYDEPPTSAQRRLAIIEACLDRAAKAAGKTSADLREHCNAARFAVKFAEVSGKGLATAIGSYLSAEYASDGNKAEPFGGNVAH